MASLCVCTDSKWNFIFGPSCFVCLREKEIMRKKKRRKVGSNLQSPPIGSRFVSRNMHSWTGRVRFLSRSVEARVSRRKSNQTVRNSSRNDLIIVWHCRLAVRIILSLSFIGTISHINVSMWYAIELILRSARCTMHCANVEENALAIPPRAWLRHDFLFFPRNKASRGLRSSDH